MNGNGQLVKTGRGKRPRSTKFTLQVTVGICTLALATELLGQSGSPQLAWLESRICPKSGLVDAFDDGQTNSPLYVNALAAIAFAHAGKFNLAAGIFNTLETLYETSTIEGKHLGPSGLLYDQRSASQPTNVHGNFRTGENAWLVLALNYYESVSGDQRYAAFATNLLEAICYYRDNDTDSISYGAFRYGVSNPAYSTEFQIDIYAALKRRGVLSGSTKYLGFATDLRSYLLDDPGSPLEPGRTKVWLAFDDPDHRVFGGELYDGSPPIYLDAQAWAVLALYPPQANEVGFTCALTNIDEGGGWQGIVETVICDGMSVTGFCDEFPAQEWVWLEGTEFMRRCLCFDRQHKQVQLLPPAGGATRQTRRQSLSLLRQ